MKNSLYKRIMVSFVSTLLICSFILAPISYTKHVEVLKAHADADDGANIASLVENGISAAGTMIQTGLMASLQIKELTLDGIAFALINIVLKEMIRSVTSWVNSGFKGSPAFVTNLEGFLLNIADKVAGNFIYGAGLGALCSPFKLNIQLALDLSYQRTRGYEAQCRLSQVVGNMDRFLGGDFAQGGWDGWYEVALTDSNPYATKLAAESAMFASISSAQGAQIKKLDFGRGFLSVQDPSCNPDQGPCQDVTPGVVVEQQLNSSLSLPAQRINVADEINELVGALLSQLGKEVLGGVGGLLGLTDPSYGGGNYFDRMASERDTGGYANTTIQPIENAVKEESEFVSLKNQIISLINSASTYRERIYPIRTYIDPDTGRTVTTTPCASGELTASLKQQRMAAQSEVTSSTITITALNLLNSDYKILQNASTPTTTLASTTRKYRATSVPEAISKIMERFTTYQTSGNLHGVSTNIPLKLSILPAIQSEVSSFTSAIDSACRNYSVD